MRHDVNRSIVGNWIELKIYYMLDFGNSMRGKSWEKWVVVAKEVATSASLVPLKNIRKGTNGLGGKCQKRRKEAQIL